MMDCSSLNRAKNYLISNHPGSWRYTRSRGTKHYFWSFGSPDVNRRVTISLSPEEVKNQVWEEVLSLDLSRLEAFRGE